MGLPSWCALARRTVHSASDGQAGILDQLRQHGLGLEVGLDDRPGRPAVSFVIGIDGLEGRHDVQPILRRAASTRRERVLGQALMLR